MRRTSAIASAASGSALRRLSPAMRTSQLLAMAVNPNPRSSLFIASILPSRVNDCGKAVAGNTDGPQNL